MSASPFTWLPVYPARDAANIAATGRHWPYRRQVTPRPPRGIHVDGFEYRWVVRGLDPDHVAVRVWRDGPGRGRQLVVAVEFDDFWRYFSDIVAGDRAVELMRLDPVTPGLTADLVRAGIAGGWRPETTGEPAYFTMVGDRAAFTLVARPRR